MTGISWVYFLYNRFNRVKSYWCFDFYQNQIPAETDLIITHSYHLIITIHSVFNLRVFSYIFVKLDYEN
jgi:hypothetical protein